MKSVNGRILARVFWGCCVVTILSVVAYLALDAFPREKDVTTRLTPNVVSQAADARGKQVTPSVRQPEPAKEEVTLAPPRPTPLRIPPPDLNLAQASSFYNSLSAQASHATDELYRILDGNEKKYMYVRPKLQGAASALTPYAITHGFADPTFKTLFRDQLRKPKYFEETLRFLQQVADENDTQVTAQTPDELMAAFVSLAPAFEKRYLKLVRSLGIPAEISDLLVDSAGTGWLKMNTAFYFREYGMKYDSTRRSFVPGEATKSDATAGTYFAPRP